MKAAWGSTETNIDKFNKDSRYILSMMNELSKLLSDAPDGKGFYTEFGEIRSLRELKANLAEKGNDFYQAYANSGNNHFANWVESVFDDAELASALRNADTHDKAVKALDDKLNFAQQNMAYNEKKETLHNYLADCDFSIKNVMDSPEFNPEHHKFETDLDMHSITKITPTKTTFLLNFSDIFQKKQADAVPSSDIMKNAVALENTEEIRHKETVAAEKENAVAGEMKALFPGLQLTNMNSKPADKKSFFERIISRFWK
jgi:hypothetical protein